MGDPKESKLERKETHKNVRVRLHAKGQKSQAFSVKELDGDIKLARQKIERAFMRK